MRRTKIPIAAITDRKVSQRSEIKPGVTAVSVSDGMTNFGGGPGFGPMRYRNAPRTGCPSAEITRQKTRYQPSAECLSGASSSYGFDAERCTGPSTCWCAAASVTETIAKRGSTTSSYTSRTSVGGVSTSALAVGNVFSSAACAQAAAGSVSATATTAAMTSARLTAPAR